MTTDHPMHTGKQKHVQGADGQMQGSISTATPGAASTSAAVDMSAPLDNDERRELAILRVTAGLPYSATAYELTNDGQTIGYAVLDADTYAESPREWDNLSTMVMSHGRYILPNEDDVDFDDFDGWDEVLADIEKRHPGARAVKVSMTDHGSVSYYVGDPRDRWDSGVVGFAYVTPEEVEANYGDTSEESWEKAMTVINYEVDTYSQWANGEVYTVTCYDANGGFVDSLGGNYGDEYEIVAQFANTTMGATDHEQIS